MQKTKTIMPGTKHRIDSNTSIYGIILLLILICQVSPAIAAEVEFSLDSDQTTSSSGYIKLEWRSEIDAEEFELQQSTNKDFSDAKLIYFGPDKASFISGLENGVYYYRVRAQNGDWSETLQVTVEHQSMKLAYTLFALGFVVFALTTFVVIRGAQSTGKVKL